MGDRAGLLKVTEQLVAVTTKGESLEERLATTKATLEYIQSLKVPFIYPLYTFVTAFTPMFTRYTCIHDPNTSL